MSKCAAWGISPFENERRLNLRTVSIRTKQRLAARADEMHNWELQETKDAMLEQSMDYADKQETLGAGIEAMRERASSERARNGVVIKKVQDTNRLLEQTATNAGMEARSLRRQLEIQNSQTIGVQAVLEDEATDLRQELGQLRTENEELRFKNRGLLDELRIAKSETENRGGGGKTCESGEAKKLCGKESDAVGSNK